MNWNHFQNTNHRYMPMQLPYPNMPNYMPSHLPPWSNHSHLPTLPGMNHPIIPPTPPPLNYQNHRPQIDPFNPFNPLNPMLVYHQTNNYYNGNSQNQPGMLNHHEKYPINDFQQEIVCKSQAQVV